MTERRTRRSATPAEAVTLFMQGVVARHGLAALVLTTDEGVAVAGAAGEACAALDLAWIGAIGTVCALSASPGPSLGALVRKATGGRDLEAREVVLRGERLYLAAVGGRLPGADLLAGIERILTLALPAAS